MVARQGQVQRLDRDRPCMHGRITRPARADLEIGAHSRFGSIDAYFHDGLGLGDDALSALRAALIEAS